MDKNIYLIGEQKDIERLSFCFKDWENEGNNIINVTIDKLDEEWNKLTSVENVVFCLSSSTPSKVYNLALERFDKKKKSINIFVEPFKLTDKQKESVGRNKSVFLKMHGNNNPSEILKLIFSNGEWRLFFPDYKENLSVNPLNITPQNQYDEDGNLILPVYDEEKKNNVGIIIGIIATFIIMAGGIVGYHFYVDSVPFLSPYMKSKPEIEIQNFAKKFALLVEQNNLSELRVIYPDIAEADSIALQYDPIEIKIENFDVSPFEIRLSSTALIKVIVDKNNNYKVISSRGLFAYPKDKMELALKTGMFSQNLTDKEFNDRMKDDRFFDYLKTRTTQILENLITVNPELLVSNPNMGEGYYSVKNNSSFFIPGSAYSIKIKRTAPYINWDTGEITPYTEYEDLDGVSLSPEGTGEIETSYSVNTGGEDLEFEELNWKFSPEELQKNFFKYTGKEYEEYLKSGGKLP